MNQTVTAYAQKLQNALNLFFPNGNNLTHENREETSNTTAAQNGNEQGDGRNLDLSLAGLLGEGAQQRHETERTHPKQTAAPRWQELPTATQTEHEGPTYYERPVIKGPVWIWTVPFYFYVGGAAGAAAVLGTVAQWFGGKQLQGLVTRCRWLAATGANLGAVLLISDLGRPSRFLNMLRVFRPTSPMSVGSWILAASGSVMTVTALIGNRKQWWLRGIAQLTTFSSLFFGIGLAGYTGVLLTNSVVPLWRAARNSLPVLFVSSGIASVAAILEFLKLNPSEARVIHIFGLVGRTAELGTAVVVEKEASQVERVGLPLKNGLSGKLWKSSKYVGIVGLLLALLPGGGRGKRTLGALCTTASSLLLRYALMEAGKASARDPHATFQQQRHQMNRAKDKPC